MNGVDPGALDYTSKMYVQRRRMWLVQIDTHSIRLDIQTSFQYTKDYIQV